MYFIHIKISVISFSPFQRNQVLAQALNAALANEKLCHQSQLKTDQLH
jgi:hypothetical protein